MKKCYYSRRDQNGLSTVLTKVNSKEDDVVRRSYRLCCRNDLLHTATYKCTSERLRVKSLCTYVTLRNTYTCKTWKSWAAGAKQHNARCWCSCILIRAFHSTQHRDSFFDLILIYISSCYPKLQFYAIQDFWMCIRYTLWNEVLIWKDPGNKIGSTIIFLG